MKRKTGGKRRRINIRAKGIAGELEAIAFLRGLGFQTSDRLIQPRGGAKDGPDFYVEHGAQRMPAISIEVKRAKAVRPWTKGMGSAMRQALNTPCEVPTAVMFRRNREPWGFCCTVRIGEAPPTTVVSYGDQIGNLIQMFCPSIERTAQTAVEGAP